MQQLFEIIQRITGMDLRVYFSSGHARSVKTKRNILASVILKAIGLGTSFLLFPLTIDYLGKTDNGIWLTLFSIITLYGFFEFGLGNGLRNRFAEARAKDDHELARTYVSTAYAIITILVVVFYVLFLGVFPYIDWIAIFNAPPGMMEELQSLTIIVFTYFSLQFILRLTSMILLADQRPAISNGLNTIGSVLVLLVIFILNKTTEGSLIYMGITVCAVNIIVRLIASFWFFGRDYRQYVPSLKYVKFSYGKDLMGLGLQFFVMQFAGIIVFSTDNFIVAQIIGPGAVTTYNTAFKFFSIITVLFSTLTVPLWSAYTEAFAKKDFDWIRNVTKKFIRLWLALVVITLMMLAASSLFYGFWVGDEIQVPFILSVFMAIFVLMRTWSDIFYYFIYGASKIKVSLYVSIFASVVNIPLSIYFARNWELGIAGVTLATCVSILPDIFMAPLQYRMIINKTARGIWNQ